MSVQLQFHTPQAPPALFSPTPPITHSQLHTSSSADGIPPARLRASLLLRCLLSCAFNDAWLLCLRLLLLLLREVLLHVWCVCVICVFLNVSACEIYLSAWRSGRLPSVADSSKQQHSHITHVILRSPYDRLLLSRLLQQQHHACAS